MKQWQVRLQKSRSYKWWVLAVIMVGTFMAVLDVTVVNVGLPTIMNVFHIGLSTAEWVVTAYMITMTIMLPTAGWLADRYGNKRIYVLGMILFTFGSWCCGRATVDEFLIFSRALQGVGSGIIQSLGLAIVSREFPAKQLSTALGLWAVAAAASISFGPLVGGFLVDDYSWHLIFDVNVPIGILGIAASLLIQKEWRNPDIGRFDWIGFVSVALFMPLVIYGLARGNASGNPHGWTAWDVAGSFAVAAVALAVFIVRELRTDHPLLDIRLLGDRHFGVSMLVLIIFGIGMFGGSYLLPLYMQNGLGYTALMAGMVFLPVGLIQGVPVDRFGHSYSLCRRAAARVRRHRRDGAELFPGQPVYGSHAPFRYHGRRLSAGIRHGTDLRAAERFLASEPESEPDGCCGGHI